MWFDWMYIRLKWTRYRVTFEADWSILLLGLTVFLGVLAIVSMGVFRVFRWGFLFTMLAIIIGLLSLYFHSIQMRFRRKAKQWGW